MDTENSLTKLQPINILRTHARIWRRQVGGHIVAMIRHLYV